MNFLLEIGCEELPSSFLNQSQVSLRENFKQLLTKYSLDFQSIVCWSTPRRLSVYIQNISSHSPPLSTEIKGPPKKIAFDSQGNPTPALLAFISNNKAKLDNITVKNIQNKEYVFLTFTTGPKNTLDILKENLPSIIFSLKDKKIMRWDYPNVFFSRPIRWLLALLDDTIVPLEIGSLTSNNISFGHRFLGKPIIINKIDNYKQSLRDEYVIVDQDERKLLIESEINSITQKYSINWHKDDELLQEVVNLIEFPKLLVGRIPERFLTLPQPLVIATIKYHLKAFPFYDQDNSLSPYFGIISNNPFTEASQEIISGYENVAKARLADVYFFFQEDLKVPLETWKNNLNNIVFFQGLGSLKDKNDRLIKTAKFFPNLIEGVDPNILNYTLALLKFEQSSQVVKELPELEGIMSKIYALEQKESESVAEALLEHYLPKSSNDNIPATTLGKWCSILDRIDTITGIFSTGHKPSGSEDPFGLRRLAIGLIRILISIDQQIDIALLIKNFQESYRAQGINVESLSVSEIITFLKQRLEAFWLEEGYRYDVVQAILGNNFPLNLHLAQKKLQYLESIYEKDAFINLVLVFKRVQNILKNQNLNLSTPIRKSFFIEVEESLLYETLQLLYDKLSFTPLEEWLDLFTLLGKRVDQFFDKVLVMTEEDNIKINRLLLLNRVYEAIKNLGDLSYITIRR